MGASRNQRSKKEATFLESVRESLHHLQDEIKGIRAIVEDLKPFPAVRNVQPEFSQVPYDLWHACSWNDFSAWQSLDFGDCASTLNAWNPNAKEFEPHPDHSVDKLSKSEVLLFRDTLVGGHALGTHCTLLPSAHQPHDCALEVTDYTCKDLIDVCFSADLLDEFGGMTWQPSKSDMFGEGSPLKDELRIEAAIVIQRWFRCDQSLAAHESRQSSSEGLVEGDDTDNDGNGKIDEGDDNSAEAVAVRRAFMASIASTTHTAITPQMDSETWTFEQILEWFNAALDEANAIDDRASGAEVLWTRWSEIEHHVPRHLKTKIVKFIDEGLHSKGFPSLRELVSS